MSGEGRRIREEGGETLGERVNEEGGKCWGSVLVFKEDFAKQTSCVQVTGHILWRHVSYTEMFRRSQEHQTSVLHRALPFSAQCAVAFDVNRRRGNPFPAPLVTRKQEKNKLSFDSILFFAPRQVIEWVDGRKVCGRQAMC